jgi:hypothetical protein
MNDVSCLFSDNRRMDQWLYGSGKTKATMQYLVASDQVFKMLEAGKTEVWALVFPRAAIRARRT